MEEEKIINGNCWVAYFDILGFKNETPLNAGQLPALAYMYTEIVNRINDRQKRLTDIGATWYDCLWFSDSFLFYSLDDSINSYNIIYLAAKHFFDYMTITKKWPVQGALTVDGFYADRKNNIFLGKAIIDAYSFVEKQDWIGLVLTPKAHERLVASGKQFTWVDGCCFREYDVPIKRSSYVNGLKQISLDCEKLWAYHYRTNDFQREGYVNSLRSICNKRGGLAIENLRKQENTLRFYETPCQCSVCSVLSVAKIKVN